MIQWLATTARAVMSPRWVNDTLAVVGLGLIAWGLGWMYLPLAPVSVGAALVLIAVLGARRSKRLREDEP